MGKAVTDIALKKKLEHFVRETAQNSADAAVDGQTPHLIYRYAKIEDRLSEFLEAIDWPVLREHYAAVTEEEDDDIGVQKMLDRIEGGSLPVLIVEDRNTEGLTGDEFSKKTNYASLLQDFGSSTKDEDEGGVHGVGASVLWGFSGLKTALFFSNPHGWGEDISPRFAGRIDLPYHESSGEEWQGDGWLGRQDDPERRATSICGDEALEIVGDELGFSFAEDHLESTGTTAIVLGFREPNRSRRSPAKVIDRIREMAAKYYWPLMSEGGLKVSVQGPDDDNPTEVSPKSVDWLVPFIEAYEHRDSTDGDLGEAPDFGTTTVPVHIPASDDDSSVTEGEVDTVIRTSDGKYDKFDNQLAMFRGARHVVKYRKYNYLSQKAGQNFRGLLIAGRGRHSFDVEDSDLPDSDAVVEDFFRKAEPEAHNTWEDEVGKLENHYPDGHEEITDLISERVPSEIAEMLVGAGEGRTQSLDTVGKQFPYFSGGSKRGSGGGRGGGGGAKQVVDRVTRDLDDNGDGYECSGTIKLADNPAGTWDFGVELSTVDAAENQLETLDSRTLEVVADGETLESSDGPVTVPESTREIEYRQVSGPGSESDGRGKVRVKFDVDAELEADS